MHDITTSPAPADLSDGDLIRELDSLHSTRHTTLRHGSPDALVAHTRRQEALEQEYLQRWPAREIDRQRLREGARER
jgi:hypothetical protein